MDNKNIVEVDSKIETICCDGGKDGLGHPTVYFNFGFEKKIICNYCGKIFLKEKKDKSNV